MDAMFGQRLDEEGGGLAMSSEKTDKEKLDVLVDALRDELRADVRIEIRLAFEKMLGELKTYLSSVEPKSEPTQFKSKPGPKPKARPTEQPPEPPPPEPPQTLEARIEHALMKESLDVAKLAKTVGASLETVEATMKSLRAEGRVYNVGPGDAPIWTWRIGDRTETPVLQSLVRRLISERPMATRELTDATGARMSRVNGVIVAIQRSGANIIDLGAGHAARWFLISDHAKDASLERKRWGRPKKRGRPKGGGGSGEQGGSEH